MSKYRFMFVFLSKHAANNLDLFKTFIRDASGSVLSNSELISFILESLDLPKFSKALVDIQTESDK